jgi:hypothetical protein
MRCYDVPSAFINADVDENMLMVLKANKQDDVAQSTTDILQIHHSRQKEITHAICEGTKSAILPHKS